MCGGYVSLLTGGLISVLLWLLLSKRLQRVGVQAPLFLLMAGIICTLPTLWPALLSVEWVNSVATVLNGDQVQKAVQITLAILLFVDAVEVRGGIMGGQGRVIARLLLLALPIGIASVVVIGWFLLPDISIFTVIVIACVVMPADFSATHGLNKSKFLPPRVSTTLTVESGYNDGMISPVFSMAVALSLAANAALGIGDGATEADLRAAAVFDEQIEKSITVVLNAIPATVLAILMGLVLGLIAAWATRWARGRGWMDGPAERVLLLIVPVIAFLLATIHAIGANGFIAAFVAGVGYHLARHSAASGRDIEPDDLALVDQVSGLLSQLVWFTSGAAAVLVVHTGVDGRLVLVAVLGLTALRVLPVLLSLLGSRLTWRERWAVALLGPRGVATVVFGLLAYSALPDDEGYAVLTATVVSVVVSIILHGYLAPALLRRFDPFGRTRAAPVEAD